MRTTSIVPASLLFVLLAGCSPKEPPPPSEYIKFNYVLTPGGSGTSPMPVTLAIIPGSQPCGRDTKTILVEAAGKKTHVRIELHDAATMPAQFIANSMTAHKVEVEVEVPSSQDLGGANAAAFFTTDPDIFSCLLVTMPPDPFSTFDGTFSCMTKDSPSLPNGKLTLTEGEFHTTMCPPQ